MKRLFRGKRGTDFLGRPTDEWVISGNLMKLNLDSKGEQYFIPAANERFTCMRNSVNNNVVSLSDTVFYNVVPETIGQITGKPDKNGKDIFEDDILGNGKVIGYVFYSEEKCAFMFKWKRVDTFRPDYFKTCLLSEYSNIDSLEVVGNIHDNPEMVEGAL